MDRNRSSRRPHRGLFVVAATAFALLLFAPAAGAQVLDDAVDDVIDVVSPVPSLVDEVTGTVNDAIDEVPDPTSVVGQPGDGGTAPRDGGSAPGKTGAPGGPKATSGSGSLGTGGTRAPVDGVRRRGAAGASAATRDGAKETPDSYTTLARRGVGAALTRAVRLAGPLAAPLLLAGLALIAAGVTSKGSKKLVRFEDGGRARTYRL